MRTERGDNGATTRERDRASRGPSAAGREGVRDRPNYRSPRGSTFNTDQYIQYSMPISADRFEAIDDDGDEPSPGTNAHRILRFLRANPDTAFTRGEIAAATDVPANSVGPTLVRLRDRGRVDHRGQYWRVSDHDRTLDAAVDQSAATAAARESDSFDHETWRAHAVDPRDDRA